MRLHTLNLDFCTSITGLDKECFSCMPNLMCLSMCETRVADLWTTTAALSRLPSLLELRFQNCLYCKDTGPCPASVGRTASIPCERLGLGQWNICSYGGAPSVSTRDATFQPSHADDACGDLHPFGNSLLISELRSRTDNLSDASETNISSCLQRIGLLEISSNVLPNLNGQAKQNEVRIINFRKGKL